MPRNHVRRGCLVATVLTVVMMLVSACEPALDHAAVSSNAQQSKRQLDALKVLLTRPDVPGYDRSCRREHRCVFGPSWSDNVSAENGHNGCDQASDQLRNDLENPVIKPGTHGCTPLSGTLHDPYTGAAINYVRGQQPAAVSIDHIVPLKLVWDLGASGWDLPRRRDLAGDPRNLVAVSARANSAKGDSSPADRWKPQRGYRCTYAERFVEVLHAYQLPVPARDKSALADMLSSCR